MELSTDYENILVTMENFLDQRSEVLRSLSQASSRSGRKPTISTTNVLYITKTSVLGNRSVMTTHLHVDLSRQELQQLRSILGRKVPVLTAHTLRTDNVLLAQYAHEMITMPSGMPPLRVRLVSNKSTETSDSDASTNSQKSEPYTSASQQVLFTQRMSECSGENQAQENPDGCAGRPCAQLTRTPRMFTIRMDVTSGGTSTTDKNLSQLTNSEETEPSTEEGTPDGSTDTTHKSRPKEEPRGLSRSPGMLFGSLRTSTPENGTESSRMEGLEPVKLPSSSIKLYVGGSPSARNFPKADTHGPIQTSNRTIL
nr:hypothetical protein [Cressdnaviricota sp.]